jgi:Transposase
MKTLLTVSAYGRPANKCEDLRRHILGLREKNDPPAAASVDVAGVQSRRGQPAFSSLFPFPEFRLVLGALGNNVAGDDRYARARLASAPRAARRFAVLHCSPRSSAAGGSASRERSSSHGAAGRRVRASLRSRSSRRLSAVTSTASSPSIATGLSSGPTEGLNGKIRTLTRRAYGFHSARSLIGLIFLCCAGLTLQPVFKSS